MELSRRSFFKSVLLPVLVVPALMSPAALLFAQPKRPLVMRGLGSQYMITGEDEAGKVLVMCGRGSNVSLDYLDATAAPRAARFLRVDDGTSVPLGHFRTVHDFSVMPDDDSTEVRTIRVERGDETLMEVSLHPRSAYRWAAWSGGELMVA